MQRLRDREVARAGVGIDIDGGAADDALDHLEPDVADGERPVEQVELVPGRPALDIEVGAEAQRMDGVVDHALDGAQARQVDDRDHLAGDVGKAVARAGQDFGRSLDLAGIAAGEELLDRGPALGGFEVALRPRPRRSGGWSGRGWHRRNGCAAAPAIRPAAASGNAALTAISARPDRSPTGRSRWRSGGRTERLAGGQRRAGERLRGQAFDGIAVNTGDFGGRGRGHSAF